MRPSLFRELQCRWRFIGYEVPDAWSLHIFSKVTVKLDSSLLPGWFTYYRCTMLRQYFSIGFNICYSIRLPKRIKCDWNLQAKWTDSSEWFEENYSICVTLLVVVDLLYCFSKTSYRSTLELQKLHLIQWQFDLHFETSVCESLLHFWLAPSAIGNIVQIV